MSEPHPQSRASLESLQNILSFEQFWRAKVMALIPLKKEFNDLREKHQQRKAKP